MQNSEKGLNPMGKQAIGQPNPDAGWRWVSERGLRVATGGTTLPRYLSLISQNLPEVEDVIPSDDSILLILHRGAPVSAALRAALATPLVEAAARPGRVHEIAVEYGGAAGPDLPGLARRAGISVTDCVERHAAADYTVAFLGFQPGFPYLSGLPDVLCAPRRLTPRVRVAAGSVAIGGAYCGIYPADGPGGWHLIGRTVAALFDPVRAAPALLMPGDRVRFVPA
jgi:KipI family sensor histidine kinase inhibitor